MGSDPSSFLVEGGHQAVLAEVDVDEDEHDLEVLVVVPLPLYVRLSASKRQEQLS